MAQTEHLSIYKSTYNAFNAFPLGTPGSGRAPDWEQSEVWNRLVLGLLTQCEVAAAAPSSPRL